jgi:hypothetical protein
MSAKDLVLELPPLAFQWLRLALLTLPIVQVFLIIAPLVFALYEMVILTPVKGLFKIFLFCAVFPRSSCCDKWDRICWINLNTVERAAAFRAKIN